jgi:hypothetical protein
MTFSKLGKLIFPNSFNLYSQLTTTTDTQMMAEGNFLKYQKYISSTWQMKSVVNLTNIL